MRSSLLASLRTSTRRLAWLLIGATVALAATIAARPHGHTSAPHSADLHKVLHGQLASLVSGNQEVMAIPGTNVQIGAIRGESTIQGYVGDIGLNSIALGATNPASVSSTGIIQGKPSASDLVITHVYDLASPKLEAALATGADLGTVKVFILQSTSSGFRPLLIITLKHTHVTQVQQSVDPSSGGAEEVHMAYSSIKDDYYLYAPDGTAQHEVMSWNLETGVVYTSGG